MSNYLKPLLLPDNDEMPLFHMTIARQLQCICYDGMYTCITDMTYVSKSVEKYIENKNRGESNTAGHNQYECNISAVIQWRCYNAGFMWSVLWLHQLNT